MTSSQLDGPTTSEGRQPEEHVYKSIRRLLQMIPVILGATFLIFAMVFALPETPWPGRAVSARARRRTSRLP